MKKIRELTAIENHKLMKCLTIQELDHILMDLDLKEEELLYEAAIKHGIIKGEK